MARARNQYVLRPLAGVTYEPISFSGSQADLISTRLTARYGNVAQMRLAVEHLLDGLKFDSAATEEFEESFRDLGCLLGFGAQRPELELGSGPDGLWAVESGKFWVVEAKTGATSGEVAKRDLGQLGQAMAWFQGRYPGQTAIPVMVHPSRTLYANASKIEGMAFITPRVLAQIVASVRAFSTGIAEAGWTQPVVVDRLLEGHGLRPHQLAALLQRPVGGTS